MLNQNNCIQGQSEKSSLRPYEKCLSYGAVELTDAELLAVILRTGTNGLSAVELAQQIFALSVSCFADSGAHEKPESGCGALTGLSGIAVSELMKLRGIGKVKAIQIQCICELSRRIAKQSAAVRLDFSSPGAIADYYMQDLRHLDKEYLVLALLDNKCRLMRDLIVSIGTVNASLVTPREIFLEAVRYGAVSVVLLHNHPSGDATPSRNDFLVTRRVREAGEILGIHLIDHIIIGDNMYTSLKEKEFM